MKKIYLLLLIPITLICVTHAANSTVTFSITDGSGSDTTTGGTGGNTTGVDISIGGGTGIHIVLPSTGTTTTGTTVTSGVVYTWGQTHSWHIYTGALWYPLPPLTGSTAATTPVTGNHSSPPAHTMHPTIPHQTTSPATWGSESSTLSPAHPQNWPHLLGWVVVSSGNQLMSSIDDARDLPHILREHTRRKRKE